MRIKYLFCLIFILIFYGCSPKEKKIKPDFRNFSIVNLNKDFPVINLAQSTYSMDTFCIPVPYNLINTNSDRKFYFLKAIVDAQSGKLEVYPGGMNPTQNFYFDKNNRLKSQNVSSCSVWNISFEYLDTLGLIYRFSKIKNENKIDTTIFKLDLKGRVYQVAGSEYGDLMKMYVTKKVSYSEDSFIPDSIESIFMFNQKPIEIRKEVFYHTKNKIDSILIEIFELDSEFTDKLKYMNIIDKKGFFKGKKILFNNDSSFFLEVRKCK